MHPYSFLSEKTLRSMVRDLREALIKFDEPEERKTIRDEMEQAEDALKQLFPRKNDP